MLQFDDCEFVDGVTIQSIAMNVTLLEILETFGDFGITRKLKFFSHNPCKVSWLKSVAFGRF